MKIHVGDRFKKSGICVVIVVFETAEMFYRCKAEI